MSDWPERVYVVRDDHRLIAISETPGVLYRPEQIRTYIPAESVQAVAERWREQARELIFTCNTSKLNPHENKVTYGKAQGLREAADQLTSFCNRGSNDA